MNKITKNKYNIYKLPLKYSKYINRKNGTKFLIRLFEKDDFKCVLCKRKTSIDTSYSNYGYKLICNHCLYNRFINFNSYRKWATIYGKEETSNR